MKSLLVAVFLLAELAHADISNPNLLPFGEEEAFLGNAGIAHEESTGATYYNPGALGFIRYKKVSVNANAYLANRVSARSVIRVDDTDLALTSNTFNPVPLSSVTVFGSEKYTYAFSIHVPFTASYEFQAPFHSQKLSMSFLGSANFSSLWIGPSFGKKVSEDFGWGLSLFAVRYSQSSLQLSNTVADNGAVSGQSTAGSSSQMKNWSALMVFGGQWKVNPSWRVGARIQTASLYIRGRGDVYKISTGTVSTGAPSNSLQSENDIYTQFKTPWEIGIGNKFSLAKNLDVLFDVNVQFPIDYQTVPSRPDLSDRVITRLTPRFNLGTKLGMDHTHSVLWGFLFNPTTVPEGASSFESVSRETFKGTTLGFQADTGILISTLGVFYLWSNSKTSDRIPDSLSFHQIFGGLITATYKL